MKVLFVILAIACTFSCGPKTINVSTLQLRAAAAPDVWENLSGKERELVVAGKIQAGMPEGAVFLVRGMPLLWWGTNINGTTCRTLLYAESTIVTAAIYTCGGRVVRQTKVEPTLPCWRVSSVGQRIVADIKYFETLSLERQWEIVVGLLKRGQAERDVTIAFGKPYNKGSESREDGSDVATSVYLAEGGETYGLYVKFIEKKVIGWKIPADRRLTPEAQQRRLVATEKRLMSQLKEMDANAEKRHRESAELLNAVLDGQEAMSQNVGETESALVTALGLAGDFLPQSTKDKLGKVVDKGLDKVDKTLDKLYRKKVYFKCNGKVIINKTFKTFEACESYRRNSQPTCNGRPMLRSC